MQDTIRDLRKNKVELSDYDFQSDIKNRILLSKLSPDAITVLEEILCNSISFSIKSLCDSLDLEHSLIRKILDDLLPTGLFSIEGQTIQVDKEKRKYFETHIEKFNDDFTPDMDYLQSLLKHIPIQVLPLWYQIPRSSNNIFTSLIEKCFLTPAIFLRFYNDFISCEDIYAQIIKDIYESEELFITANFIKEKYQLSAEKYQEIALYLELNLLCASNFQKKGNEFIEILSPFQEWKDYTFALRSNKPPSLSGPIIPYRESEFAFIEDMSTLLLLSRQADLEVTFIPSLDEWVLLRPVDASAIQAPNDQYLNRVLNKLLLLGLAVVEGVHLRPSDLAQDWIKTPIEKRAHITFKHPHHFLSLEKHSRLSSQRGVLEIEKSIAQVVHLNWISLDDFLSSSIIALGEEDRITLKRISGRWVYKFPEHDLDATNFIRYVIMNWLFECGMVQIGSHQDAPCFRVTSLGQSLFQ